MNKTEKKVLIDELTQKFNNAQYFYIADDSSLSVEKVSSLRRACFEKKIEYKVVKNSLIQKALEASTLNAGDLFVALKGQSALMFSETSSEPAKLIKQFRAAGDRPILKGAYIDSDIFVGDNQLNTLSSLKSKNELIGDVLTLLQSPIKRVIGGLVAKSEKDAAPATEAPVVEAAAPAVEEVKETPAAEDAPAAE